jgi:hypothetical protein
VFDKLNNLDEYVRQENEEQQRRALNAINNVAGLLPAVPDADKPRTSFSTVDNDDAALRDVEARHVVSASKPFAADIVLDDELDDLLGEMTGADA